MGNGIKYKKYNDRMGSKRSNFYYHYIYLFIYIFIYLFTYLLLSISETKEV